MSPSRSLALTILLAAPAALACGPDFPFEFLSRRDETLAQLPDGLFMLEAGRLVSPPTHPFTVAELEEPAQSFEGASEEAVALYRSGARLWSRRDAQEPMRDFFEKLLALPEAERRPLTLPAEYSLAENSEPAEARQRFARVRELAAQGWLDPRGLAVASLGEEARLARDAGDDTRAIALYAEQASHGSQRGAVSLLFVARDLIAHEARLDRALVDPLAQRLISTYLWTRSQEDWWSERAEGPTSVQVLERLMKVPHVAGADRLAAALFRAGRFEDAARMVEKEETPIAHWVKAKLLLRRGQREAADRELEQAAAGYPLAESWSVAYQPDFRPRQQVELERTILALSRDDFEGALRHAETSCSWEDVAYLAERVLDLESLKKHVDGPAPDPSPCAAYKGADEVDTDNSWKVVDQHRGLRRVLARRLLREGRGAEALGYFEPALRAEAERYLKALAQPGEGLARAQALYVASTIARDKGMELLGYEGAPDFNWTEGSYAPRAEFQADAGLSDEEWRRYQASGPTHAMRFHYRAVASHLAEQAADLVSPRSQAFTALLCKAAVYVNSRDDERVAQLWRRAVKEGPLLSEPMVFAQECPTPRFEPPPSPKRQPLHLRKRTLVFGGAAGLGVVALIVGLRRRKL